MKKNLKNYLEGLIIVLLGVACLVLALQIRNNPVKVPSFINVLVQAKMLPVVVGVLLIVLGVLLTHDLSRGKYTTSAMPKEMWIRIVVLTAMTLAYLIITYFVGFLIPTVVYSFAMLMYLNWKQKNPALLAGLAVVYTAVTVYLVPLMLNFRLM